jgi:hypothetical protein
MFRSWAHAAVVDPQRFATVMNVEPQQLWSLAGVDANTETPAAEERIQRFIRDSIRALILIEAICQDSERSIAWFRHAAIPELEHQTAETVVAKGQVDVLVRYLTAGDTKPPPNATSSPH